MPLKLLVTLPNPFSNLSPVVSLARFHLRDDEVLAAIMPKIYPAKPRGCTNLTELLTADIAGKKLLWVAVPIDPDTGVTVRLTSFGPLPWDLWKRQQASHIYKDGARRERSKNVRKSRVDVFKAFYYLHNMASWLIVAKLSDRLVDIRIDLVAGHEVCIVVIRFHEWKNRHSQGDHGEKANEDFHDVSDYISQ